MVDAAEWTAALSTLFIFHIELLLSFYIAVPRL